MTGYQFGIEEEYFISDLRSKTVRSRMSKRFFRACKKVLGDRVMNEMFQSQIEVATSPCQTMQDAAFATIVEQRAAALMVASDTIPNCVRTP
jgi:carboxylate-amine ligase